jgi:hypothetical protein
MIPSPPGTAPAEQPSASLMWNRTPSSRARRTADGGCPNIVRIQIPCGAREVRDFHMRHVKFFPDAHIDSCQYRERKPPSDAGSAKSELRVCTNSGHMPVDGVHSIEKTCTYKRVFSIDWKNRRSTTRSFFDSFLSFTGWCGVRGSSGVTFPDRKIGKEGERGSTAKRWSRRTEKKC